MQKVKEKKLKNVIALILPHAGYKYSGQTAAYGLKELQGHHYSRVVVMGPSHKYLLKNKISVPDYKVYKTPFGSVPLDIDFIKKIEKLPEAITEKGLIFGNIVCKFRCLFYRKNLKISN